MGRARVIYLEVKVTRIEASRVIGKTSPELHVLFGFWSADTGAVGEVISCEAGTSRMIRSMGPRSPPKLYQPAVFTE